MVDDLSKRRPRQAKAKAKKTPSRGEECPSLSAEECEAIKSALSVMQNHAYRLYQSRGFHPEWQLYIETVPRSIALIHADVSRAMQSFQDSHLVLQQLGLGLGELGALRFESETGDVYERQRSPSEGALLTPSGIIADLASVVIRCLDLAQAVGGDMSKAFIERAAYERTLSSRKGDNDR